MKANRELRNRAFHRTFQKMSDQMQREDKALCDLSGIEQEKFLYSMIMYLVTLEQRNTTNMKDARELHALFDAGITLLSSLSPTQLERMFPIAKDYDGERWGVKDYFSTREALPKLPQDEPIYKHTDMFELLWDYRNPHINHLLMAAMHSMDEIRKWMGKCSMMEEYLWKLQTNEWKKLKPQKRVLPAWLRLVK